MPTKGSVLRAFLGNRHSPAGRRHLLDEKKVVSASTDEEKKFRLEKRMRWHLEDEVEKIRKKQKTSAAIGKTLAAKRRKNRN